MEVKELFVPYEIALKIKEKGFNEICLCFFDYEGNLALNYCENYNTQTWVQARKSTSAPLYQQAIEFINKKLTPRYAKFVHYDGFILISKEDTDYFILQALDLI
jgi:hypothetical protein